MTVPGQPVAPERVPIADRFDLPAGVAVAFSGEPCRASERATGETVGIQRLAPEFAAGAADLERVRALLHPNLVRVRALLSDDAGPYFVIEWPERGTLAERRAAGPLSKARLFAVARDVSRALSCLHEAGMACADLGARCILETERGTFKLSGYGAPQGGGDEATAVLPAGARSLAGADRFRLDLASFAALIEDLCEDVPASLRPVLERCRPGSPAAFGGAAELGRALADLPEAKVLPEVVEAESAAPRAASARPAAALGASPPGAADAATGRFPWRPVGDLYRLEGDAMDGGMGSVRMATEIATGRKVAVKRLLLQSGLDASVLERFRREANSIARLSHPHILQLLQPARDEQGDYLVLEWAAGGSLRERLNREGALPAAEVIDIARKIGGALAYAHKKGVIHRDVKPHNILLTETGEPKLADFGLARSAGDLTLSTSRAGAGSPLYMPPEQFDASRSADARSDVYSLGKTLYHLVTNASPAVPEARLIPAELRRPLMRCMEADPAKRPASVEEFLAELTEVKRRPLWPVLAAVLVVALAAGLAVQQFLRRGAERPAPPSGSGEAVGQPAGREAAKTAPRVLLAGFFTGGGDQELQNGDKVEAESVDVRLRFEPPPAAEERPAVVVRRGGEELAAEEWSASWQEDGLLVLTVPLAGRDNELVVEVPSLEFQSAPREVVRFDPEPMLKSVSDAEDLGQGRHITAREQVELTFEVARGKGIRTLWLAQNDVKQAVELQQDGTVRHQARLTEGKNEFLWYWPDEASRVSAGEQVVVADFSAPAVEVHQPEDGFLTNGAVLHVDGRVVDANCGKEATWRLLCGGAEKARGAPALEPNGNFQADAVLPSDVEGELVLEVSAADQVSRLSEPVRVVVRADRTAPLLARPPEFAPAFGEGRVLAAVTLRGLATEPLKSATVNGVPARLDGAGDAFEKAGLEAREGEAYEIVLTDRAGNASQPLRFAHGVDTEPPQAELSFAERDGALLLLVRPKERLKVLEVDGAALAAEALAAPEIAAPVSGTLAERTTYKGVPGPTLNPIKVRMLDLTENETVLWLVVCPEDKETAVVCRMKDGQAAGTEPCSRCNGQYCPRTGAGGPHKPVSETDLRPVDYWVKSGHGQCEYCGWPKK